MNEKRRVQLMHDVGLVMRQTKDDNYRYDLWLQLEGLIYEYKDYPEEKVTEVLKKHPSWRDKG